jgi:hypothetical protein
LEGLSDMLLDGFFGNLTSSKGAKLTKTSPGTALRDIQDLIDFSWLMLRGHTPKISLDLF